MKSKVLSSAMIIFPLFKLNSIKIFSK